MAKFSSILLDMVENESRYTVTFAGLCLGVWEASGSQVMVALEVATACSNPVEASFLLSALSVCSTTACFVALPLG